jgi:uncharacterized HAD superfamily protein
MIGRDGGLHIGVDLDNTVLDATSSHLKYFNIASGLRFTPDDVHDFYLYRLYGWDKSEADAVYRKYGHWIHWESEPFPMAVDILRELYGLHRLSIITSRPVHFRDVTLNWLTRHNIHYHRIIFAEDKLKECLDFDVDVLIDDGPHYAEEFAREGKPVVLFEQPYNSSIDDNLVLHASNWLEVKNHINQLNSRTSPAC